MITLPRTQRQLLLASSSPYRRQQLAQLHLAFDWCAPDIDETPKPCEPAPTLARRLACQKARSLAVRYPNHLIIGSDQTATVDGKRLGKPGDIANACAQLRFCSGKSVTFYSGVCLLCSQTGRQEDQLATTQATFRRLSKQQIERYVERERPFNCAGSFKCESQGIALFEAITSDDPSALVGLPLIYLTRLLQAFNYDVLA